MRKKERKNGAKDRCFNTMFERPQKTAAISERKTTTTTTTNQLTCLGINDNQLILRIRKLPVK